MNFASLFFSAGKGLEMSVDGFLNKNERIINN